MAVDFEPCYVCLATQCVGIGLVALLLLLLTRTVRRPFLHSWAAGWACMALALATLLAAFVLVPAFARPLYAVFFLGEYAFGFLLIAGCRNYAGGPPLRRREWWWLAPGALVAGALPCLGSDFSVLSIPHDLIFLALWAAAYLRLRRARRAGPQGLGFQVMCLALLLLPLDFAQYVVVQVRSVQTGNAVPFPHMKYSSLYDLVLEVLLAFGMVVAVMESVRQELEGLTHRLRVLAERDPLTEAMNRHAFHTLLHPKQAGAAQVEGCVAVLDIDEFKHINDRLGHAAGDAAIRAVARALRGVVRADDLLFRWGGDEFLLLLPGVSAAEAAGRLARLDGLLAQTRLPGVDGPVALVVSWGLADFLGRTALEAAIDEADRAMYRQKQARKVRHPRLAIPPEGAA